MGSSKSTCNGSSVNNEAESTWGSCCAQGQGLGAPVLSGGSSAYDTAMSDTARCGDRVWAVFALLKKRQAEKIRDCGNAVAEAVLRDQTTLDPGQIIDMLNIWLDACIEEFDQEALESSSRCLRFVEVGKDLPHPGLVGVLNKVLMAIETPSAQYLDNLLAVRVATVRVLGDLEVLAPLMEIVKHTQLEVVGSAAAALCCRFFALSELRDEEVKTFMQATMELVQHLTADLGQHVPGNMEVSRRLACELACVGHLLDACMIFCTQLLLSSPRYPRAADAAASPVPILSLQEAIRALKPKAKEVELVTRARSVMDVCRSLLSQMPRPPDGPGKKDAEALVLALQSANDAGSLNGIVNQMLGVRAEDAASVVLGKECLESLADAFQRAEGKTEYHQVWQTMPRFLAWAAEKRPGCLEPQGDQFADLVTQGPVVMVQPRPLIDALVQHSPAVARKLWVCVPNWENAVSAARGTSKLDGVLYAVVYAIEGLPRALEGDDLESYCRKAVELSNIGKGTPLGDPLKCSVLTGLHSVIHRDKSRMPQETLEWVNGCKAGQGQARELAGKFLEIYEGRSGS